MVNTHNKNEFVLCIYYFQKEIFRHGAVALWLQRRFITVCVLSVTSTRVPSYDIDRLVNKSFS